jgi:hypothetical protein
LYCPIQEPLQTVALQGNPQIPSPKEHNKNKVPMGQKWGAIATHKRNEITGIQKP